jgi:hypothetical protein
MLRPREQTDVKLDLAITKAWDALPQAAATIPVRFLADTFLVDVKNRKLISLTRERPAGDDVKLLILHYLSRKIAGLPAPTGKWLSMSELSTAVRFMDVFYRRAVDRITAQYGDDPGRIRKALENTPGRAIDRADSAIVLEVFEGVLMLIEVWRADEEFGPEANILFDRSITDIFCLEDIVVLAEVVATAI